MGDVSKSKTKSKKPENKVPNKKAAGSTRRMASTLRERVKELTCLYAVSDMLQKPGASIENLSPEITEAIAAAYQYPDITAVRLLLGGRWLITPNYKYTKWKQESPIMTGGHQVGAIEVYYLEERPDFDEGPFMKEERALLDNLARQFGYFVEHERADELQGRLAAIVESSRDAIIGKTLEGIITSWNKGAEVNYGYTAAEAIGQPISMLVPPEHIGEIEKFLEVVKGGGSVVNQESMRVTKYGRHINVLLTISPIRDISGRIIGASTIAQNITELKRAASEVKRVADEWQATFDSITDMVSIQDKDFKLVRVNKAYADAIKESPDVLIGQFCYKVIHGTSCPIDSCPHVQTMKTHLAVTQEVFEPRLQAYLEVSTSPIFDADGEISGSVHIAKNITERKRADEALRQSEERFRDMVDLLPEAVCEIDVSGNILFGNRAAFIMVGYNRADFDKGLNILSMISPEDHEKAMTNIQKMIAGEDLGANDYTLVRKDGSRFPATVHINNMLDASGKTVGFRGIVIDITEHKLAEAMTRIRLSLLEFSATHSLEELLQKTLDEVGELTGSPIGFYHFVEKDQKTLSLQAWSTRTVKEFCTAEGRGRHYGIDKAGVWVDCVRQRKPVVHNDYYALPHRRGMPKGHAPVTRELVVPIMRKDKIVAILGVGNKTTDYDSKDVEVVSYLADVAWEITERKRAEMAVAQERERLSYILRGTNVGTWEWNIQTGEAAFNDRWAEIVGYTLEELSPVSIETWVQLGHPDDLKRSGELLEKHFKGELDYYECEARMLHKDGRWVWVLDRGRVHAWTDDGKPLLMSGTHQDITERKQAEEALRQSEKKYRALFDDSIDAVLISTVDGKMLDFNEAMLKLTGYGRDELLGLNAVKLYANPADRENFVREMQNAGSVKEYGVRWLKKDGTEVDVVMTLTARLDQEGNIAGFQGVIRDVTERKKIEQMKTDFVSFISHQLRTPIGGLMGYIDNMLEGITGELNNKQTEYLNEMRDVCARSNRLIADLLNASRIERGVLAANIRPVVLREMVDAAVKEYREAIKEKGLVLNIRGEDRGIGVLADSDKLVEVLKNVVHNAFKFTKEGSIDIEISSRGSEGIIKVKDSGIGMTETVMKDLFRRERMFSGSVAVGGGAGLGLYIAKGFMKLQGGDITAESSLGKGSIFTISVPKQ